LRYGAGVLQAYRERQMSTNHEKLAQLKRQVDLLARQIEVAGREDECLRLLDDVSANPTDFEEVTDEEWDAFLNTEQERALPRYYCSCRLRLRELELQISRLEKGGLEKFLNMPYLRAAIHIAEIGTVLEFISHIAHAAGLFGTEDHASGNFVKKADGDDDDGRVW
jgi:hypothetical protein